MWVDTNRLHINHSWFGWHRLMVWIQAVSEMNQVWSQGIVSWFWYEQALQKWNTKTMTSSISGLHKQKSCQQLELQWCITWAPDSTGLLPPLGLSPSYAQRWSRTCGMTWCQPRSRWQMCRPQTKAIPTPMVDYGYHQSSCSCQHTPTRAVGI
jgi:hypothetical protein